jgi:prepilin-type N-terminal cleavage/methylation domain-containing protein
MNTIKKKDNIEGFSLVELLVVIALICVLMAMIFPIARNATERSVRSTCLSSLQIIGRSVGSYQQDHGVYPPMPGAVGARGVPTGGITGLALEDATLSSKNLWCEKDPYPDNFPAKPNYFPRRDSTNSSYARDYNYYGYATDVSGMPFPIPDAKSAYFLYGTDVNNGDLKLVEEKIPGTTYRPKALFPGLWNPHASPDTMITYCHFHNPGTNQPVPVPIVNLAGTATIAWIDKPSLTNAGYTNRRPAIGAVKLPPIDWRINKSAFPFPNKGKMPENKMMGDSLGNATADNMPIIRSFYRQFADTDIGGIPPPGQIYKWYDTGIDVQQGDIIMVLANSKWNFVSKISLTDLDTRFKNTDGSVKSEYSTLFNEDGYLWFSPEGDVFDKTNPSSRPTMFCPNKPHCMLVGMIGDLPAAANTDPVERAKYVFPIGSRYSYIVPAGVNGTFRLAMNDTANNYTDNQGWGEIWVGYYRTTVQAR